MSFFKSTFAILALFLNLILLSTAKASGDDPVASPPACAIPEADRDGTNCRCTNNRIFGGTGTTPSCVACETGKRPNSDRTACECEAEGHLPNTRGECVDSRMNNFIWRTLPTIIKTSQFKGANSSGRTSSSYQCGTNYELCIGPAESGSTVRMVKCYVARNAVTCPSTPNSEGCIFLDAADDSAADGMRTAITAPVPLHNYSEITCGETAPTCDSSPNRTTDFRGGCKCPASPTNCVNTYDQCSVIAGQASWARTLAACRSVGQATDSSPANQSDIQRCARYCRPATTPSRAPSTSVCTEAVMARIPATPNPGGEVVLAPTAAQAESSCTESGGTYTAGANGAVGTCSCTGTTIPSGSNPFQCVPFIGISANQSSCESSHGTYHPSHGSVAATCSCTGAYMNSTSNAFQCVAITGPSANQTSCESSHGTYHPSHGSVAATCSCTGSYMNSSTNPFECVNFTGPSANQTSCESSHGTYHPSHGSVAASCACTGAYMNSTSNAFQCVAITGPVANSSHRSTCESGTWAGSYRLNSAGTRYVCVCPEGSTNDVGNEMRCGH